MPEFQLDHGTRAASQTFRTLDSFTQGYIEAMFFTDASNPDDGDLDGATFAELAPEALSAITFECAEFQEGNADLLAGAYAAPWRIAAERAGWSRVAHSGMFSAPLDHPMRLVDYDGWRDLCECEGVEPHGEYDETHAGRDFWYTRNGHGAGFWDRGLGDVGDKLTSAAGYAACDVYRGDDGLVYVGRM